MNKWEWNERTSHLLVVPGGGCRARNVHVPVRSCTSPVSHIAVTTTLSDVAITMARWRDCIPWIYEKWVCNLIITLENRKGRKVVDSRVEKVPLSSPAVTPVVLASVLWAGWLILHFSQALAFCRPSQRNRWEWAFQHFVGLRTSCRVWRRNLALTTFAFF